MEKQNQEILGMIHTKKDKIRVLNLYTGIRNQVNHKVGLHILQGDKI